MKEGDKVLVLLPTKSNKLLMQWRGPYTIVQKIGQMEYKVDVRGKGKTLHAYLMKTYIERDETICGVLTTCAVSLIILSEDDTDDPQNTILPPQTSKSDTVKDGNFAERLTAEQRQTVGRYLILFVMFSDFPCATNLVKHKIEHLPKSRVSDPHAPHKPLTE